jgi:hypothetical protein
MAELIDKLFESMVLGDFYQLPVNEGFERHYELACEFLMKWGAETAKNRAQNINSGLQDQ